MPERSTATKAPQRQARDTRAGASAGPGGAALAPPAYGIDVVDHAPAGRAPHQLMPRPDWSARAAA
jgi:hypothetical protein